MSLPHQFCKPRAGLLASILAVQAPCRPRAGLVQARAGHLIFRADPLCAYFFDLRKNGTEACRLSAQLTLL